MHYNSPNVEKLLKQRYYQPNETWEGLIKRVIDHVCQNEPEEFTKEMYHILLDKIWLPNSPCLVNSGTKTNGLVACFTVGPREDSLEAHVKALGDIAAVGKRGGGAGFTGSFIRPKGSPVAGSSHGFAYGPNNWAVQVNNYLGMITQGGFRNMALMYTLRSDHPDLESFLNLKQTGDESFASGFNQSIMAKDDWMREAKEKPDSKAGKQFDILAKNAWGNGEPGLLFYDTINGNTPYRSMCDSSCGYPIEATNPCGEQPLPDYLSCVLGSINVAHDYFFNKDGTYNYPKLSRVARLATRFLDNIGSVTTFPTDKFKTAYNKHRPIGLGIMGYADALLRSEIRYGSGASLEFMRSIMGTIYHAAHAASVVLGQERGVPLHCKKVGRRNITLLTIAPTGSIGFIAETSHSIEPHFSPSYTRTDERGETYEMTHPLANEPYFISCVNPDPNKVPTWEEHIAVQAAAQEYVDSACSKTINMPNTATIREVKEAMFKAWEVGCKGITVYRNGSRKKQVLVDKDSEKRYAPVRPPQVPCKVYNSKYSGNNWVILIGLSDKIPFEIFTFKYDKIEIEKGTILKIGGGIYNLLNSNGNVIVENITNEYRNDEEEALTRLISLALRHNIPIRFIVEQLNKSKGTVTSFSKVVNRSLRKHMSTNSKIKCPDCQSRELVYQGGCFTCNNCGSSACG